MTRPALGAALVAANLVLFSLFDNFQSGFAAIIGVAMIGCCLWLSAVALHNHRGGWLLLFLPVALLWNPIVTPSLRPEEWFTVYLLATVGLVCAGFFIRAQSPSGSDAAA